MNAVDHSRCCAIHGCRYGDNDCPTLLGIEDQAAPCHFCTNMGLRTVADVHAYLGRIAPKCPTCGQPIKPKREEPAWDHFDKAL